MLNPEFSLFNDNMFVQMRALLDPLQQPEGMDLLDVTIGEPRLSPPEWLNQVVSDNWQAYPKAVADTIFLDALDIYFENRFPDIAGRFNRAEHIVPVPGTREPLHFLGTCVRGAKPDAAALVSNPFYHAWRTGALFSGGEIIYLSAFAEDDFLPDLHAIDEDVLKRTSILYLCSPSNPHGSIASADYIAHAIALARHYDFLLVMDECYIDIWRNKKPISALQVALDIASDQDEDPFHHLVILNSLSKRSSAAGLRVGFLCGDKQLIAAYTKLVANGGALVPTPLLHAGGRLYTDETHNQKIRSHYDASFDILQQSLDITVPDGGFFLWYKVSEKFGGDDRYFAQILLQQAAIKAVSGSFMATETKQGNPGAGYVRMAIVHDHDTITRLATRLAELERS